jgi:hypothetical protein
MVRDLNIRMIQAGHYPNLMLFVFVFDHSGHRKQTIYFLILIIERALDEQLG